MSTDKVILMPFERALATLEAVLLLPKDDIVDRNPIGGFLPPLPGLDGGFAPPNPAEVPG